MVVQSADEQACSYLEQACSYRLLIWLSANKQKRNGKIKRSKQESGGGGTSPYSADGQKRQKTNIEQCYPLVAFTTVFLGL
jgi:hypothetical protein